ncbi:MAG: formate/nitrite transporter family protein [Deltaproteobacteria bacterium]|nr:formate/nitrite transporter family protein [Deltaproteobacteria bacterium]
MCSFAEEAGAKKVLLPISKLLILGILAGAFIGFASEGSTMAAFNLLAFPETYGLGRCVAGVVFPTGLMLVVLAGGELFTGNTLMGIALVQRRINMRGLLRNWFWVYLGNLIGSIFLAHMMANSGLFNSGADLFGGVTIKIASGKVSFSFLSAFYLGIMCNWLVCLAVWIAYGAKDIAGKILGIFFPIWLFITSGFEHCVANMYYIPAGIMAKSNAAWAAASGLSSEALDALTWGSFAINNLLPVTLGNIVGGLGFVGMAYWFSYRKQIQAEQ